MDPRFTSRKWLLTLFVIALTIASRWANWVDGAQFVSLLTWIVGLYMAGNVAQTVAGNISITSKPDPVPTPAPVPVPAPPVSPS
jgi:hypothetical protein